MDYKLDLLLKDFFEKSKELELLNNNIKENINKNIDSKEMEIKAVNNDISSKLFDLEFDIGEINKRIINLEYNKELELKKISNATSDIIDNMIDNNERRKVELKYDNKINILKDELNSLTNWYEELKKSFETRFEKNIKEINDKYNSNENDKYNTDEINSCKRQLLDIITSKLPILNDELEQSNIQKDGLTNLIERMVRAPYTLDDTCIDFLETQIENLKLCFENEKETIKKNEYDKNISDLEAIVNKIKNNVEINDYDKKVVINQINILDGYNNKVISYIDTFRTAEYIKLEEKKEEDSIDNNLDYEEMETFGNNETNINHSEAKTEESTLKYEEVEDGIKFNSEIDSIDFILKDILSEIDNIDSIYLESNDRDNVLIKIDDKKEKISLDGLMLPSGEYISSKDIDDAIDRYYSKNKGKTYYIKERKFILNRTHAYQITPSSINNLKDALKNRSTIKLINQNKLDQTMVREIFAKEALMEDPNSSDEYEFETVKEKNVGTIESGKEGKYISKKQLGYYLSEIFERKGPIWIEKLKNKFFKEEEDEKIKEIIKKI